MKKNIRLILQLIILALIIFVIVKSFDVERYCPFGGILSYATMVYQNTMACNMTASAVFMAFVLVLGALAIGKLFCSYVCPIGLITEWLGKLGKLLHLHFDLPKILDRIFRSLKYILLFIVLYSTVTKSELFCRTFDPYYAVATGFGHDVVFTWALIALLATILGSIFIKQFWCKYLCPLGAATNLFVNFYLILVPFIIYLILVKLGIHLSIIWLFGTISLLGFVWEVGVFKFKPLPFTKITVDHDGCTKCMKCVAACPHGIEVCQYEIVDHPDCMLCTDCVYSCDVDKAIKVNHSDKLVWLPAIMVVALMALGFILSNHYEFRTLQKRWGGFENMENLQVFHQSGLKNVKCYGSSMALYRKIKDKKGIYGLDTYAKSHTVNIYYDPNKLSEAGIRKELFSPRRYKTRTFKRYKPDSLTVWEVGIDNLFDIVDHMNMIRVFNHNLHVFGFESEYGDPVMVRIFFDSDSTNAAEIKKQIDETKHIERKIRGKKHVYEMDFQCKGDGKIVAKVPVSFYEQRMFGAYDQPFNGFENEDLKNLSIYEIGIVGAENFMLRRQLPYLVSHISGDSAIVRFKTSSIDGRDVALIYFDPALIDTAKIHQMLVVDTLKYYKSDDTVGFKKNIYQFKYPSKVHAAADFVDPVAIAKEYQFSE
ncbi:MAG: 4Fe-4S binding protein [Calditrichaeota bacterium]|nr:4Fe-4S binding protein [Calditrichota bacterium]